LEKEFTSFVKSRTKQGRTIARGLEFKYGGGMRKKEKKKDRGVELLREMGGNTHI
jgi:hypothetical protein